MDCTELRKRLRLGEGLSTEFKRCGGQPGDDVFETVCSFANRQGGDIFLGVSDNGDVLGVPDKAVASIQRNIVNVANNPKLFNVAPVVEMEAIECEGKTVIRVWVPMGPAVYSYKGTTYDRMADADVRVVGVDQISLLYLRKQDIYSEQRVYPYVTLGDLRPDVIDKARHMALMRRPDHPWGSMSDEELLRSSKLYAKNRVTGQEGYTLAAVLLVGDDDTSSAMCARRIKRMPSCAVPTPTATMTAKLSGPTWSRPMRRCSRLPQSICPTVLSSKAPSASACATSLSGSSSPTC